MAEASGVATRGGGSGKICVVCGQDCSNKPRTKDAQGRYFCQDCYDQAVAKKKLAGSGPAKGSASQPAPQHPRPQPRPKSPSSPPPPPPMIDDDRGRNMLDMLLEQQPSAPAAASSFACPSCGSPMQAGSIICVNCGYNVQTGQALTVKVKKAPKERAELSGAAAMLLSPAVIGLAVLAIIGGLYAMTWGDPDQVIIPYALSSIFSLGVSITVLVFAFRESVGTGFLTLCVPCYILYFVFAVCDNGLVKGLFGVSIILAVIGAIALQAAGLNDVSSFTP